MTDDTTESVQTRWDYTNDAVAVITACSFVIALGYGYGTGVISPPVDLGGLGLAYVSFVLLAGVWLFGTDAFNALRSLRG